MNRINFLLGTDGSLCHLENKFFIENGLDGLPKHLSKQGIHNYKLKSFLGLEIDKNYLDIYAKYGYINFYVEYNDQDLSEVIVLLKEMKGLVNK